MLDYARSLGDVVRRSRRKLGLTQSDVAAASDIDVRTVLNIENYKGNPKLEVLYPLVRTLKIDAREIFHPEMQKDSPTLRQIRILLEDCSEQEAESLLPVIKTVLSVLRSNNISSIK